MRCGQLTSRVLALGAVVALVFCGCSEEIVKSPIPNEQPDTRISSDSPRPHEPTSYRVRLNWIGNDPDGRIVGYYIAWDDTLDGQGNPTWVYTTANESTFVVTADSCANPPCQGEFSRFFDYHTFWVKSVDDQGAQDPTPAYRTFTSTTVAPSAEITIGPPTICVGCLQSPEYVFFQWRGTDPDGSVAGYWYKWGAKYGEHPYSKGSDPTTEGWVFLPAESTSVAARQVAGSQGCVGGGEASFAVFAVDDAGAVQQISRCPTGSDPGNWECFCPDPEIGGPGICIDGGVMGVRSTSGHFCDARTGERGDYKPSLYSFGAVTGVFAGTGVRFRWTRLVPVDRSTPAPLVGYRYAIDDPSAWARPLSRDVTQFPDSAHADTIFSPGLHTFYVEALDRAGVSDLGSFKFLVSQGPTQSDPPAPPRILYVDDNGSRDGYYSEWQQFTDQREDEFWLGGSGSFGILDGYAVDQFDTQVEGRAPGVPLVASYTTVVWNAGVPSGGGGSSWLRDQLFGPRAEYLSSYVRSGGNVILCGMNPLFAIMVSCPATGLLGDVCCTPPSKGPWMYFDPSFCGLSEEEVFPHFLFTRLGCGEMRVPLSNRAAGDSVWQITPDRVTKGCRPFDPSGLFSRYLKVDSLKAGGPRDNPPGLDAVDWLPAPDVTVIGPGIPSWVEPIYYLDASDPEMQQDFVIGFVARGDLNPRKPASDPHWGNVVFLGSHLFFYKTEDAYWFMETALTGICGEVRPTARR